MTVFRCLRQSYTSRAVEVFLGRVSGLEHRFVFLAGPHLAIQETLEVSCQGIVVVSLSQRKSAVHKTSSDLKNKDRYCTA